MGRYDKNIINRNNSIEGDNLRNSDIDKIRRYNKNININRNNSIEGDNLRNSDIDKIMRYDKNIDINRYNSNVKICPNINAKGFCDTNNCENFHPKKILLNLWRDEYQNFSKNININYSFLQKNKNILMKRWIYVI